jgi:hypothetical protein
MAADMDNSGRCSLAEFSRLHLEAMKQAKPGQGANPVSAEPSSVLSENSFAHHVVSGMLKLRESERSGFRNGNR